MIERDHAEAVDSLDLGVLQRRLAAGVGADDCGLDDAVEPGVGEAAAAADEAAGVVRRVDHGEDISDVAQRGERDRVEDNGNVVLAEAGAGHEGAAGLGLDGCGDADAGQHRRDRLADAAVVDIPVVGAGEGQAEAVGVAGVGEELACGGRVGLGDGEFGGPAKEAFGDDLH